MQLIYTTTSSRNNTASCRVLSSVPLFMNSTLEFALLGQKVVEGMVHGRESRCADRVKRLIFLENVGFFVDTPGINALSEALGTSVYCAVIDGLFTWVAKNLLRSVRYHE